MTVKITTRAKAAYKEESGVLPQTVGNVGNKTVLCKFLAAKN